MVDAVVAHADMADHVTFHGSVTQEQLVAFYQGADIFLCVSDHEGFCVPVIEAMHHQLPVIAYNSSAVGETVRQGGLLLNDKHPLTVAAALNKLAKDDHLTGRLRIAGAKRAAFFNRETTSTQFTKEFVDLLGSP
jgi:glycosyltransferase involved in cell wall biosynthesis